MSQPVEPDPGVDPAPDEPTVVHPVAGPDHPASAGNAAGPGYPSGAYAAPPGAYVGPPPGYQPYPPVPRRGAGARMGAFARHRATQVVAALIIGLGLGAGGMAIILHGNHAGRRPAVVSESGPGFGNHPFGGDRGNRPGNGGQRVPSHP